MEIFFSLLQENQQYYTQNSIQNKKKKRRNLTLMINRDNHNHNAVNEMLLYIEKMLPSTCAGGSQQLRRIVEVRASWSEHHRHEKREEIQSRTIQQQKTKPVPLSQEGREFVSDKLGKNYAKISSENKQKMQI